MKMEQPAPVEGPVVLGIIGKYPVREAPTTDSLGQPPKKKEDAPGQRIVTTAVGLCGMACPGLFLGASIHREIYGLSWLLLGLSSLLCVRFLVGNAKRFLSGGSGEPPVPDERSLVRVDRLKAYTESGALGTTVKATGATIWLTDEGMYLASGKWLPWSRFTAFDLETPSASAYRIRLWKRRFDGRSLAVAVLAVAVLAAGGAVEVIAAIVGFHRFGLRDDILALTSAAVSTSLMVGYMPLWFWSRLGGSSGSRPDNLVLVSRSAFSDETIISLLSRHLIMKVMNPCYLPTSPSP